MEPVPVNISIREYCSPQDWCALEEMENLEKDSSWSAQALKDSVGSGASIFVLTVENTVSGYCLFRLICGEMEILNLVIGTSRRRNGLGRMLLESVIEGNHAASVRTVWLEVRESNLAARKLYTRTGFETVTIRKNYYPVLGGGKTGESGTLDSEKSSHPAVSRENALVMKRVRA